MPRHALPLVLLAAALAPALPARAQDRIALFDAHLHYNQEPSPLYPLETVLDIFRRNDVTGILATSRPNKGTHQLVDAKASGLWVVPFIRPYRTRADIQTWFNDDGIYDLIVDEYRRGHYRGIGEFHLFGRSAATPLVEKIVNFAVERNLHLHAHCDEEALLLLFSHNPKARIIWAHTGFSTPPERLKELFKTYPELRGELSYRSGITDVAGHLTPEWRELFALHSDRFLIGSDTWINERWFSYDGLMKTYRAWLAQLPPEQAARIASGNAVALFGPRKTE
ncbi:MAG: amidohydrolase family protein [Pseudorhodoplanes sp.]|nr:MAG: amidohydrolase family protein [Pseudorhodoplanes sp.]